MDSTIDGITIEVVRSAFQSISEEMGSTLIRTSLSPNIKDRMDASTAVYTSEGELISQAEHIPLHLGLMPSVVEEVLKIYPQESLQEGDAILINDPYISGSHLPDVFLLTPVFYKKQLVSIVGNIAHHVDVGGMVPGSSSTNATEIFQEGLRIPAIRLCKNGEIDEDFLRLFLANVRSQEAVGDLYAQIAANNIGVKRILELYKKYDVHFMRECVKEIIDYSYRRMLHAIKQIPNGKYKFKDFLEGDGITEEFIKIEVELIIHDEKVTIDFSGTDKQSNGPINSTLGVTKACAYYAIKSLFDSDIPPNAGAYIPIEVFAPEETVVHAKFPAAVSNGNSNTSQRIVDTIFGALSFALPEKSMAACVGSMNGLTIGGYNYSTNKYFSYIETYGGGQGGMDKLDGMDGVHTNMTNTKNTPVEVIEQTYPLFIKSYSLAHNSSGSGKYRGGMGIIREIAFECEKATVIIKMERSKYGPWGLFGGGNGEPAKCFLTKAKTGETHSLPVKSTIEVERGDILFIQTAGGGGYSSAQERSKNDIENDLSQGVIDMDYIKKEYHLNYF